MLHLVEPFDLVVHNQSTECFVILLCHNTFAKSYDSKVGLISQKRCIPVTVFAALLLPILLYYCCRFCCTAVTIFAAFLDAGYTNIAKDPVQNEIHVPVVPLQSAGYNLKNNWQISAWTFGDKKEVGSYIRYSKPLRGTIKDDITNTQVNVYGVDLDCIDAKGNTVKVEFGTLQLMEGMAKEVEELAYPATKGLSPYNPYYIARDVADSIIKGIGGHAETMIALYDLSLQSSVPGYTFVSYLENKAKLGYNSNTLSADIIYKELLTSQTNQSHLGQVSFQDGYGNAIGLACGVIGDFTGRHWVYRHIDYWYDSILKRGSYIRFKYPRLYIDLAKQGDINTGPLFKEILDFMGTPLISNKNWIYESRSPKKVPMNCSSMADIYAMVQTSLVFASPGSFECALKGYCANKKCLFRKHKVDERCSTEPWKKMSRFNRCPFCQWWYFKGFSKTRLINP